MATVQIPIPLFVPDATGNAYPLLIAGTVHRHLVPAFTGGASAPVGDWYGHVRIPQNYASTPQIVLSIGTNNTTGVTTMGVATAVVVPTTGQYNPASYTAETDQDVSVLATAYLRKDVTFSLSTTPAAGNDLLVRVRHNGTATNDTLTTDTILFSTVFQYAT